MYRDHRKGPGGPPGGATYPGGPHGLKWRGNQPLVGWCAPPKGPRRLGLETLGEPLPPEGACAPLVGNPKRAVAPGAAAPPLDGISKGACAPLAPIYSGGEGGQPQPKPWRLPLPPVAPLPPLVVLGEALLESRCFHHHVVVLLDLHQPLLPPCWIKKGGDVAAPYVC